VALATCLAGCAARVAPRPPLFPPIAEWKTLLDEVIVPPIAASSRRVFVATRDGALRALDPKTGEVLWKVDGVPGRLSATEGVLLVRGEDGALTSLHPRTGAVRWRSETGVKGELPALVDGDRVVVAGDGVAALALETGVLSWLDAAGAPTTAPPVAAGGLLLSGEQDGTLRCRARDSGRTLWTVRTREALRAPPLVDLERGRLYLGATDRQILEVGLERGHTGWSWRIGADVAHPGLLLDDRVLFAPHDAVLYALHTGGNLAWRAPLPSRPLSAPLAVDGRVIVACQENELVAVGAASGAAAGRFQTPAQIQAAPVLAGGLLVVGLRDRSVIAYAFAGAADAEEPSEPEPDEEAGAVPVEGSPARR